MNLLAIDTSSERATVALSVAGVLYYDEQDSVREHAQRLLPMIAALLSTASVSLAQLDGIVFGEGPGSFTGLRIACSMAKALAYAHDLPLFPVSTLAAINEEVRLYMDDEGETQVLAVLDARMQQVYWGCFTHRDDTPLARVSDAGDVSVSGKAPVIIAGVGVDTYRGQLSKSVEALVTHQHLIYPEARAMIRLVLRGAIQPVGQEEALPVYVRDQI